MSCFRQLWLRIVLCEILCVREQTGKGCVCGGGGGMGEGGLRRCGGGK